MNDTAQETTAAMATLVEHEVLGASLLSVEGKKRGHIAALLLIKFSPIHYQYCKHNWGERSEPHTCGVNGKLSIYMYIIIYMYVWYVRIPYIYILPHLCAMQYFHIACYSDRFTVAHETRLARQKG